MKTKTTKRAAAPLNPRTPTGRLNKLIAGLGGLSRSCCDVRRCSRCNDRLTDPSSWERGQGPICAQKDTALYAKTIQANFTLATAHALSVKPEMLFSDIVPVWDALRDVLFEKSERAISAAPSDTFTFSFSGEDCRLIAKVIDWMLSFPNSPTGKSHLIQVVKHLGFIGLAGVLSGKSSTGEAELKCENGKLSLTGSSNKAGFLAMRRIPGIVVPRYRGKGSYECPVTQHVPFIAAVMEFWPCFNGEVDSIVASCEAWIAAHPAPVVAPRNPLPLPSSLYCVPVSVKPTATVNKCSETHFVLTFAWDEESSPRLVNELKTIAYRDRNYNPVNRSWVIKLEHKARIVQLFKAVYDVTETEVADSSVVTKPASSTSYRPYSRFARRY